MLITPSSYCSNALGRAFLKLHSEHLDCIDTPVSYYLMRGSNTAIAVKSEPNATRHDVLANANFEDALHDVDNITLTCKSSTVPTKSSDRIFSTLIGLVERYKRD